MTDRRNRLVMDLPDQLEKRGTVLLDASLSPSARCFLYTDPKREISAARPDEIPGVLEALDRALSEGNYVAGYLSYESGYGLEPHRFADRINHDYDGELGYPLAWFGVFERRDVLDSASISAQLSGVAPDDLPGRLSLDESEETYRSKVGRILELIHDGDLYQVNFTARLEGDVACGAVPLYALMRRRQPVSFGAFLQLGGAQLLSASPERFIEWEGELIASRPMKGTAPRGATQALDALLAAWLRGDTKSRAENLMIVDLLRNDLSIVCEPGSVRVPSLFEVETYETVLQMTSTVTGRIAAARRPSHLLKALFPCGSVTGAPKIRAMRRILELEASPRGIYCGAIGHISPGGKGAFSVAIRTLSFRGGAARLGSGGGIVWDSNAGEEYRECQLKSRFLTGGSERQRDGIRLIETMRWESGILLQDLHLARLERSAAALGFACSLADIVDRLEVLHDQISEGDARVVRLLLDAAGSVQIEIRPLDPPLNRPCRVALARRRIDSSNPFLQFKSTFRAAYDAGRREAAERSVDELLYLNERDELTEGTITNVFLKLDAEWVTPPLSCGVLPGVCRELEMRSERVPSERILSADDLRRAEQILLTNAVRGRLDAVFVEADAAVGIDPYRSAD